MHTVFQGVTLRSFWIGWSGNRGRSLLPGRMYSGGIKSAASDRVVDFFSGKYSTTITDLSPNDLVYTSE